MASWSEVVARAPGLADRVEQILRARKHHTLATVRRDGSPRVSGSEVEVADGELWIGSMAGARKGEDLRRDPRGALHALSDDPPEGEPAAWLGDAKIAFTAVLVDGASGGGPEGGSPPPDPTADRFRLDVHEVSHVCLAPDASRLLISAWSLADGVRTIERT
jgi:hypothetical protein